MTGDEFDKLLADRVAQLETDRKRELRAMCLVIGGVFLWLTIVIGIAWQNGQLRGPVSAPTTTVTTTVSPR